MSIKDLFNTVVREMPMMIRMIEKQMQSQEEINPNNIPENMRVQFFVNGKRLSPRPVMVRKQKKNQARPDAKISKENLSKISKLPKKEPASKIRRIDGKVVYEFEVPGVKEIQDIFQALASGPGMVCCRAKTISQGVLGLKRHLL